MRRAGARAPNKKFPNLLILMASLEEKHTITLGEIDFSPGENLLYFDVASM
jgi:hypothetical protein